MTRRSKNRTFVDETNSDSPQRRNQPQHLTSSRGFLSTRESSHLEHDSDNGSDTDPLEQSVTDDRGAIAIVPTRDDDDSSFSSGSSRSQPGTRKGKERSSNLQERDKEESGIASATVALCICMLTHSYLLISVFPYSGYMAIELIDTATADTAGSYAGLIASSFMVGRATTSIFWGKVADTYGRTTVLYLSLGLSCVLSLGFGLVRSFTGALIIRFCMGASNGIMSTIKTTVSELANGNEKLETTTMSVVIGCWGWGFLLSPALSGALADPIKQYGAGDDGEDSNNTAPLWLQPDKSTVGSILFHHKFLLPNLLAVVICIVAIGTVRLFVRETLPESLRRSFSMVPTDIVSMFAMYYTRLRSLFGPHSGRYHQLKARNSDIFNPDDIDLDDEVDVHTTEVINKSNDKVVENKTKLESTSVTMSSILSRPKTRICLWMYWLYSFIGLTVDEGFPLFCISPQAGFGLTEMTIGKILSLSGLVMALLQFVIHRILYNKLGLYKSIQYGALLSGPTMFLMPLARWMNAYGSKDDTLQDLSASDQETGRLRPWTFVFLATMVAMYRIFAFVFFSNIAVAINRTVPTRERATMNGLSMLGGSVAKALGPLFAGVLVSLSVRLLGSAASVMIFGVIGSMASGVVLLTFIGFRGEDGLVDEGIDEVEDNGGQIEDTPFVVQINDEDEAANGDLVFKKQRSSRHGASSIELVSKERG